MRYLLFLFFCGYTLFAQTPDPLLASNVEDQIKWVDSTYVSLEFRRKNRTTFYGNGFLKNREKSI